MDTRKLCTAPAERTCDNGGMDDDSPVRDRRYRQINVSLPADMVVELDRHHTPLVSRSELVRQAVEALLRDRPLPQRESR